MGMIVAMLIGAVVGWYLGKGICYLIWGPRKD